LHQKSKTLNQKSNLTPLKKISLAIKKSNNKMQNLSGNDITQTKIRKKEKKMEMSIYALLIIVTVALMLLIFNLLLMEG
jgi:hypothetical protein